MRARLLTAVLTLVLVAAACGGDPGEDGAEASSSAASPTDSETSGPRGDRSDGDDGILAFEAPAVDGTVVDVSALAGSDLAIWFWAPW